MQKRYTKPTITIIEITENLSLLASSPNLGFNISIVPPTADEDEELIG